VEIKGLTGKFKNLLLNIILKGQSTWNTRYPAL